MGCDRTEVMNILLTAIFQSTHPSWGATLIGEDGYNRLKISIHAPIVGCDSNLQQVPHCPHEFQSTHPSWGATRYNVVIFVFNVFQSTHPSWGATTRCICYYLKNSTISIHAPIVGCDAFFCISSVMIADFNPRTHRGVRQQK